jgi:hypothetical protein
MNYVISISGVEFIVILFYVRTLFFDFVPIAVILIYL